MRSLAGTALVIVLTVGWFVTLRPTTLGGPAAYVVVSGQSMQPALAPGELVIARRQRSYDVGDVIVYRVPKGESGAGTRVIHRLIGGSPTTGYITRGDNRRAPDRWRPRPGDVEGAQLVAVPGAGRAMMLLGTPVAIGGLLAVLAFLTAGESALPRRWRRPRGVLRPATPVPLRGEVTAIAPGATPRVVAVPVEPAPVAVVVEAPPSAHPAPAPLPHRPSPRRRGAHAARRHRVVAAGGAIVGGAAAATLVARGVRRR